MANPLLAVCILAISSQLSAFSKNQEM